LKVRDDERDRIFWDLQCDVCARSYGSEAARGFTGRLES
jgi:hypothetical protein